MDAPKNFPMMERSTAIHNTDAQSDTVINIAAEEKRKIELSAAEISATSGTIPDIAGAGARLSKSVLTPKLRYPRFLASNIVEKNLAFLPNRIGDVFLLP
ncbi:MAG: hypothetical protein PHD43_23430, partial [Methylococcales bacterium]|nr:hypothetical protein [Methylococcales bacterium]